jgi:hypothetical protein
MLNTSDENVGIILIFGDWENENIAINCFADALCFYANDKKKLLNMLNNFLKK